MLNFIEKKRNIYPYIHDQNNKISLEDIYRPIQIPDVQVSEMIKDSQGDFSVVSGDFLQVYSPRKKCFDVVMTCFFLDTSHFVLDYIDLIWDCLDDQGYWLNLGPLTYHYSNIPGQISVEFTWNEILEALKVKGFTVEKVDFANAHYCQDINGMKINLFKCGFFKACKKLEG